MVHDYGDFSSKLAGWVVFGLWWAEHHGGWALRYKIAHLVDKKRRKEREGGVRERHTLGQDLAPRTSFSSGLLPSGRPYQFKFPGCLKIMPLSWGSSFYCRNPWSHFIFSNTCVLHSVAVSSIGTLETPLLLLSYSRNIETGAYLPYLWYDLASSWLLTYGLTH